jgi:hypothetical protein
MHLLSRLLCLLFAVFLAVTTADSKEEASVVRHSNALIHESSPYLQQHAHNPVDWHPWGDNAFALARLSDKPIFLSIGYSTCHWCHVMEHESFEDEDVAAAMNAAFVAIKVDREQRPDIDQVYMKVAQLMTEQGGWPLNVILTPDGRPFYVATYIPKQSQQGRIGLIALANRVQQLWQNDREKLLASANRVSEALRQPVVDSKHSDVVTLALVDAAYQQLSADFDQKHGGFGVAPKFPAAHKLMLLLRYARQHRDAHAITMVEKTLDQMRHGGIFDQLGYGFHRYATDQAWLLPHFEKMLYDQAMLMMAYTEAYQVTGHQRHAHVVAEIAEYVLQVMRAEDGAFYTAEDADSEGEEGRFYVWSEATLQRVLSPKDAQWAQQYWHISAAGNYLDEARQVRTGKNILYVTSGVARDEARLQRVRRQLLAARAQRVRPFRDQKVLADWNGLMIAALAKAGASLARPDLQQAATQAMAAVLQRLQAPHGRLWHERGASSAGVSGHLDDYAFMTWAMLELYQASFDPQYLQQAVTLNQTMIALFSDKGKGFYFTAHDAETLLLRPKDAWDGAIPSGNAVAAMNLVRLARLTGDVKLEQRADAVLQTFEPLMRQAPAGQAFMLMALWQSLVPAYELVLAGDVDTAEGQDVVRRLRQGFYPDVAMLHAGAAVAKLAPFTALQEPLDHRLTFYLCRNRQCELPQHDVHAVLRQLDQAVGSLKE